MWILNVIHAVVHLLNSYMSFTVKTVPRPFYLSIEHMFINSSRYWATGARIIIICMLPICHHLLYQLSRLQPAPEPEFQLVLCRGLARLRLKSSRLLALTRSRGNTSCNTCYGGWAILHWHLTSVRLAARGPMDTGWSFDGSFTTENRNYLFRAFSNGPF